MKKVLRIEIAELTKNVFNQLRLLRLLSMILMLTILAGCGFQLRGAGMVPSAIESVTLDCAPVDALDLCSIIRNQLATANIVVVEGSDASNVKPENYLVISSVENKRRAASIARDASAAEIEFSRSVDFSFHSVDIGDQPLEMTARQFQTYQYTELSVLGKEKEEQQVKNDLDHRLASEILNRLASAIALANEN